MKLSVDVFVDCGVDLRNDFSFVPVEIKRQASGQNKNQYNAACNEIAKTSGVFFKMW